MAISNKKTSKVFDDLEAFQDFCVEYGYSYRTEDLYNNRSHVWRLYNQRFLQGKPVKNMWEIDGKRIRKSR